MIDFIIRHENDELGQIIAEGLQKLQQGNPPKPVLRNFVDTYFSDGSPKPRIQNTEYDELKGKNILLIRRPEQFWSAAEKCQLFANYPRIAWSLANQDIFRAANVDVLHPFFIMGKQDHNPRTDSNENIRTSDKGMDIGSNYEAHLFKGCRTLLTFHPHFHRAPGETIIEGVRIVCLDAIPAMMKYAKASGLSNDCIVLSPDFGGVEGKSGKYNISKEFANCAGLEFGCMNAERTENVKTISEFDANGKNVILVDDCTSTFGTIATAVKSIKNAKTIDVYVVHAMLSKQAHEKALALLQSGAIQRFVSTDTVKSEFAKISVADAVVEYYRNKTV